MRPSSEPELNCASLTSALERRWDGELAPVENAALDRHLAACPDCARKASVFVRLQSALHAADGSTPILPSGAEWTRRVAAQDRGFRQGRRALGLGGLSLAGAMLVFALYFRGTAPAEAPHPSLSTGVTHSAAAPPPLPSLLVIDDEDGGRQVFQSAPRTE